MRSAILAVAFVLVAVGAQSQASLGHAVDAWLAAANVSLGVSTRDGFVKSMVKKGFKCRAGDEPAVDVMCAKGGVGGVGQTAKFGKDGTAKNHKMVFSTDDDCQTALWHLEARFGKPDVKDGSAKGWILSKTRFLGFYDVGHKFWHCDVMLMRTP